MNVIQRITKLEDALQPPKPMMFLTHIDDDGEHWENFEGFKEYFDKQLKHGKLVGCVRCRGNNLKDFDQYLELIRLGAMQLGGEDG